MSKSDIDAFNNRPFARLKRLYITHDLNESAEPVLDKDQSHYLMRVLRMNLGDALIVFNGRDGAWLAQITDAHKNNTRLQLQKQIEPQPKGTDLVYIFAPIKSARLDYIVQKAVEMGASALQPVLTQFTQSKQLNFQRLKANMIEAAEQCETLQIGELLTETSLEQLIAQWPDTHPNRYLILCDECADAASNMEKITRLKGRPLAVLVGPEGGFSSQERALLQGQNFVVRLSLGPRILRADTAGVAAMALVQALAGDWYQSS